MADDRLNTVAEQLFNKIRGRFPNITIGDADGNTTNVPSDARFYDFEYADKGAVVGKVSCALDPEKITIMYSDNLVGDEAEHDRQDWYNFLKGLRQFSRSRMLGFDVRNINKDSNTRRDYKFLAANKLPESVDLENYIKNL
jgi:hypothetical protein